MFSHSMLRVRSLALVCLVMLIANCGGEAPQDDSDTASPAPQASTATAAGAPGAVDHELAEEGEELFTTRACGSCHTIGGGRLVGPDLLGVTDRRSHAWIMAMILNPDSMIRTDSIARRLLGEYFTPMANQNLSRTEATALYHFLLSNADADSADSISH